MLIFHCTGLADNREPKYGLKLIANCVNASYAQIMWNQIDPEVELMSLYYNCSSPTNDSLILVIKYLYILFGYEIFYRQNFMGSL